MSEETGKMTALDCARADKQSLDEIQKTMDMQIGYGILDQPFGVFYRNRIFTIAMVKITSLGKDSK
jgi:hypothetical protein